MIPRARTRTIRDTASHRRRSLHTSHDMPRLYDGAAYGIWLEDTSMLSVVAYCARWMGKADLTITTFGLSVGAIDFLAAVKALRSITWIVDAATDARRRSAVDAARKCGEVYVLANHAKVAILLNDDIGIVVSGSANATQSRSLEHISIDVSREYAVDNRDYIMRMVS